MFSAAVWLWPVGLAAQTDNRLAVGLSVTTAVAGSSETAWSPDFTVEVRLGHQDQWGWTNSFLNSFDAELDGRPTIASATLGDLRIRPVMVGYGYTKTFGKYSITGDVLGGYSFNSFHLDPGAIADYQRRGLAVVDVEATNTLVVKPEIQLWYDLSSRIGLKFGGGYLISRPTVTIATTLGQDSRPVRADAFLLTFAVVYSIF